MDLTFFRRRFSLLEATDQQHAAFSRVSKKSIGSSTMRLTKLFTIFLIVVSAALAFSLIFQHKSSDQSMRFAHARAIGSKSPSDDVIIDSDNTLESQDIAIDKLLGGLLAAGFNEDTCLSRYQSVLYRKATRHEPSPYLLSKLRNYENLHRRCGPHSQSYNKTIEGILSGQATSSDDCKYIVWVSFSGLGNRILTLASAFLYALLTDRVLLIDRGKDMVDLFCEPFPDTSWLLPSDFPITDQFNRFDQGSPVCYGNMLKENVINTSALIPSYLYLHLVHDYGDHDKMFFCEGDQAYFEKVPWLIMKTDNYFVPSLFLIPAFELELSKLFPEKESVFHHLGRYLFHPSNHVWGLITRYYQAYLAGADERIGIQIRTFDTGKGPFKHVMDQVTACIKKEKLLPDIDDRKSIITKSKNPKLKSVLVTSLHAGYSENLRATFWEHPTVTGDIIGVHQPSQEEFQQTEKKQHNRKAYAEMYLLSLTDVLITSSWSTFGYVAQGLGGLRPWILTKPENHTAPDPPCGRAMSMEPCFHAPPFYDCKAKTGIDTGKVVPHVRHCEDMSWGLKVVGNHDEL